MSYWSRNDIEVLADSILLDCFHEEYAVDHMATNIDKLAADYLHLSVSYMKLSDDGRILGLTTYKDVNVEFCRNSHKEILPVRKDSMLIEKDLLENNNGRRRFTVAHEAAHQVIFRTDSSGSAKLNYLKQLPNKASYSCRELKSAEEWCEWQANSLGAALLMPETSLDYWMYRFHPKGPLIRYGRRFAYRDGETINSLMKVLGVSRTALIIRLGQLGYICQRPETEYADPLDIIPNDDEVNVT